ncbi:MAG: hypothetical protein MJY63_03125 [Paludibacteraceae bacterium]|nr:hypothetical protein [Paludibacteraceae bacterium]
MKVIIKNILKYSTLAITFIIALTFLLGFALLISFHLEKNPLEQDEERKINSQMANDRSQTSLIKELTSVDFPTYKMIAFEYAEYSTDFIIECEFQPKLSDAEYQSFIEKCISMGWKTNDDESICFYREWKKKEDMEIPKGLKENTSVSIDLCQWRFWITYKKVK